jgi:hypothetical protein
VDLDPGIANRTVCSASPFRSPSPLCRARLLGRRLRVAVSEDVGAGEPGIGSEDEWIEWAQAHVMLQVLDRNFRLTEKVSKPAALECHPHARLGLTASARSISATP